VAPTHRILSPLWWPVVSDLIPSLCPRGLSLTLHGSALYDDIYVRRLGCKCIDHITIVPFVAFIAIKFLSVSCRLPGILYSTMSMTSTFAMNIRRQQMRFNDRLVLAFIDLLSLLPSPLLSRVAHMPSICLRPLFRT
jgi:hypothetical protein